MKGGDQASISARCGSSPTPGELFTSFPEGKRRYLDLVASADSLSGEPDVVPTVKRVRAMTSNDELSHLAARLLDAPSLEDLGL